MIAATDKGRVRGGYPGRAKLAGAVVAGAAAPLSVEELEVTVTWYDGIIRSTKSTDFCESFVAGPTLVITGAVMRIRRDVVLDFL